MVVAGSILTVVAVFAGSLGLTHADTLPGVTLDTWSGKPGTMVNVSGWNFLPGETVDIFLNTTSSTAVATTTVADSSLFGPVTITIPALPQGNLAIVGVGASSGVSASNAFYVDGLQPAITLGGSANTPGSALPVSGTGFAPNEGVTLSLAGASQNTSADASGAFSASFIIPFAAPQTYVFQAIGQGTHADAFAYFFIGGFFSNASPSLYYLSPGTMLSFNGSGFGSGETVNVLDGSSTVSSLTADASGNFSNAGGFMIPFNETTGQHMFTLVGATSHAQATVTVTIAPFAPLITPSTYNLLPGATIDFSGSGFGMNEIVDVYETGSATPVASTTADASGAFGTVGTITIPQNAGGEQITFTLKGEQSNASAVFTLAVQSLNSLVTPSAYFILPGGTLTFSGSGFAASETVDVFEGDVTTTLASFSTDASGTFSNAGGFTIPFAWAGSSRTLRLHGETSDTDAATGVTISTFSANVSASLYYAFPGQTVNFTGSGFADNETINIVNASTSAVLATATADGAGAFSNAATITLPFMSGSSLDLLIEGAQSGVAAPLSITLAPFTPAITPSVYFLQRNEAFTIDGTAFAPNESVKVSAIGNAPVMISSDSTGAIHGASLIVPLSATDLLTITAKGQSSGASASTAITVGNLVPRVVTTSTLMISLNVVNTAGGSATSSDFTVNVAGADANPASFPGDASGTTIVVDADTSYAITASSSMADYTMSAAGNCTGTILTGASDSCAITEAFVFVPSLIITPASLPDGTVNMAYSEAINTSANSAGPIIWSVASGTLPDGFALDTTATGTTMTFSGTPTAAGIFDFVIKAADSSISSTQEYTINIAAAAPPVTVVSNAQPVANYGGGGGGGGGSWYYTTPIPTVHTLGTVLGASTVATDPSSTIALLQSLEAQLVTLEQELVARQFKDASCIFAFNDNLSQGMTSSDVKHLQEAMNYSGFTQIAAAGAGSPGNESIYFGPATKKAVIAFQDLFAKDILMPAGLSAGNGFVGAATRAKLNALCIGQ